MAEPLKNQFGPSIVRKIARQIAAVWPEFPEAAFVADALDGFEAMELMPRGRHIAHALRKHLPEDYERAIDILLASIGPRLERQAGDGGMASFFYLPHANFVGEFGLDHLDVSMRAQHAITQRFTAEFSIRGFLERHEAATLVTLHEWTADPDVHVRRLVSEGTRPRLPWAGRLRRFQANPSPVIALLNKLKDDPELYVRRSVANNLNDIGKDHPEILVKIAAAWMKDASKERQALVRHALRSLVKAGDQAALKVLGFGRDATVSTRAVRFSPARVRVGGRVVLSFYVVNTTARRQRVLVDLRVHFVKANGKTSPKVFKLKVLNLEAGEQVELRKTISVAEMTTRRHYPGPHVVDALLNGRAEPIGAFTVTR